MELMLKICGSSYFSYVALFISLVLSPWKLLLIKTHGKYFLWNTMGIK